MRKGICQHQKLAPALTNVDEFMAGIDMVYICLLRGDVKAQIIKVARTFGTPMHRCRATGLQLTATLGFAGLVRRTTSTRTAWGTTLLVARQRIALEDDARSLDGVYAQRRLGMPSSICPDMLLSQSSNARRLTPASRRYDLDTPSSTMTAYTVDALCHHPGGSGVVTRSAQRYGTASVLIVPEELDEPSLYVSTELRHRACSSCYMRLWRQGRHAAIADGLEHDFRRRVHHVEAVGQQLRIRVRVTLLHLAESGEMGSSLAPL